LRLAKLSMGVLMTGSLALGGCPSDDTGANETGEASSTSTGEPATSTSTSSGPDASTSSGPATTADETADGSSSGGAGLPEFDCEGVDGVLEANANIMSAADLVQLEGIREVTRSIVISQTELENLDALGCIETVGENLQIFGNESLTNIDGLVNVKAIGENFIFTENHALVDFDGLQRLPKVDGSFSLNKNDGLTQISGFDSLVGIEGDVTIRDNGVLLNIDGLKSLRVVNGVLAITANPMLCISSVNCVGAGIIQPPVVPPDWSTNANDPGC
jgi:hypothetical protein